MSAQEDLLKRFTIPVEGRPAQFELDETINHFDFYSEILPLLDQAKEDGQIIDGWGAGEGETIRVFIYKNMKHE